MPNATDPYGAYAYQERILRENKFMLSISQRHDSNINTINSPHSQNNGAGEVGGSRVGTPRTSRPATPRGEGAITLNTLSGELSRASTPRGRSNGTIVKNRHTADQSTPLPNANSSSIHEQQLEKRVGELEGELQKERKGRSDVSQRLQQLENLLEEKASAERLRKTTTVAESKGTTLPAIPTSNAFRSPRRMPHNLY